MRRIIFFVSVGVMILPLSAADETKNDEIITLGYTGRQEAYKATLKKINGSNLYQIDGDPVYQADGSVGSPFFGVNGVNGINDVGKNGAMSVFNNLNKIAFSFEDGVRKISLIGASYSSELKSNAQQSYVGQLMPLLGADPTHVTNTALAAYKNNNAVKNLDPLCGQGPHLAESLSKVKESNDFAFAHKDITDKVIGTNGDARIAHLLAEVLKTTSLEQMVTDFYSPSTQHRITSRRNTETILDKIFSIDGVTKITSVLAIAAIALKLGDYVFKFGYTLLLEWWKRPSFIVYMSMPRNILERIWFFIVGKPAKLKDTWKKIILPPVIKKQRDAWYKQLKLVLRYNKKILRYRDRVKAKGMTQNFLFVSGPPGTGKTMLIEALGAKAEKELGAHIIMFSGSEASKLSQDKIIPAMNEIYTMAEKAYLSNGAMTLVLIDEGDMFFGDRFKDKTSEAAKAITAKFLHMMPEGAHRFLVFVVASNVDVRDEQEAKKYIDWAVLDRFSERIIFNAIENNEEGWKILYEAFMLYLKETATTLSLKIDTGVAEYVKDRISEFALAHNTPRKMKAWSSSIVKNIAADLAEKKNKRKKITQDHLMEAFEAEQERKKIADRSSYQWASAPVAAAA